MWILNRHWSHLVSWNNGVTTLDDHFRSQLRLQSNQQRNKILPLLTIFMKMFYSSLILSHRKSSIRSVWLQWISFWRMIDFIFRNVHFQTFPNAIIVPAKSSVDLPILFESEKLGQFRSSGKCIRLLYLFKIWPLSLYNDRYLAQAICLKHKTSKISSQQMLRIKIINNCWCHQTIHQIGKRSRDLEIRFSS